MDDPLIERLSDLAPDVDVGAARSALRQRRRRRQQWFRATFGLVVVTALVGAVAIVRGIADDSEGGVIVTTDSSAPPESPIVPPTTAPSPTTTSEPTPPSTAPPVPAMTVSPFGVASDDTGIQISEREIESRIPGAPGEIVLSYELDLGIFPLPTPVRLVPPTVTEDGQLALEIECSTPDCSIEPLNDQFQTTIRLVVRTTEKPLTTGVHIAAFTLELSNETSTRFDVQFYAQPSPSGDVSDLVARSTGEPAVVQRVFGVGRFAYHAIAAFDSIWIVGQLSNTVARIDATSGELLATIPLDPAGPPSSSFPNRLAAGTEFVYAAGAPVVRIDPADNTATRVDGGIRARAVTASGTTSWAAGRDGVQRIDPDGTITTLDLPDEPWFDLAVADGTIWALAQGRGPSSLLAFDAASGAVRHVATLDLAGSEYAVRIVADGDQVVIGTDTSGGGGGAGRILVYDAATATELDSVVLDSRPEGIVVTDRYIWTSGAIIDRATLTVDVEDAAFGFTITRGPDGSIWGTTGIPGSGSAEGVASRWAPGDYAG